MSDYEGIIVAYEDNWADEMDIFGLRFYKSRKEYFQHFCWEVAFEKLDIAVDEMAAFLGLNITSGDYERSMVKYFSEHPNEMREKYQELAQDYSFDDVEDPYINFIYTAMVMRLLADPNDNPWTVETYISVGTNEEIPITIGDYFNFMEPVIFAEGEVAKQLVEKNPGFKYGGYGPFYFCT